MATKKYILEGLCCPSCAAEIEARAHEAEGVKSAAVDFKNTSITVTVESDADWGALMETLAHIAADIDEDIVVRPA